MSAAAEQVSHSTVGVGGSRLGRVFVFWVPLVLFIVLTLFPFFWMTLTSLKANAELYNLRSFPFWIFQPSLEHYQYLFEKTLFLTWLKNTLIVSLVATAISLVFSVLAGYALARLRFWGAGVLGVLIFVSYLVPQTLLFIPLFDVIKSLGLMTESWAINLGPDISIPLRIGPDTYASLFLTYPTFLIPFSSWLLMGYFRSIPKELEESAMIDGSSRLGTLFRVVLPLAAPGLLSAGIFAFTLSWNEYIYSLVFITSSGMKTLPIGIATELIRGDQFYWGELMAGAVLASVPVAVAYSFLVDYYVAGLTAGAVKG
jgi:multiple sugar transport system permease protein